jgi:hypothetical protein
MPTPDNRKARAGIPGLGGGSVEVIEDWQRPITEIPATTQGGITIASFDDLRRITRDLETIADWRDDLACRLRLAQLRLELVGLDTDEQDALKAEVAAFKQVCSGLAGANSVKLLKRRAA